MEVTYPLSEKESQSRGNKLSVNTETFPYLYNKFYFQNQRMFKFVVKNKQSLKRNTIITLLCLILGIQNAFPAPQLEISLLTCSGGNVAYEAWGHSALRVIDHHQQTDICYNFGIFDFNTPHFYEKFIQGKLKYQLGLEYTSDFLQSYQHEGRQVTEQKLNLPDSTAARILARLEYLYQPAQRYYEYHFIGKNCTTELRDVLFGNIPTDFINKATDKTYRTQLSEFLTAEPWTKFGMNLIMGISVDRKPDLYNSLFLPAYLYEGIKAINVNGKKLVAAEKILTLKQQTNSASSFLLHPVVVFSLLLIIALLLRSSQTFSGILFFLIGITGLFILTVSLFTEHQELKNNFNLLWCNPLYLLACFFVFKKSAVKLKKYLCILLLLCMAVMVVIWIAGIQHFEYGFLPIVGMLVVSIPHLNPLQRRGLKTNPT
jgi:hypothetical protein